MVVSLDGNPIHGAVGKLNLFGCKTIQGDARDHGVLQARSDGSSGSVKVAAGNVFFVGRASDKNSVDVHRRAGRCACDLQFIGIRGKRTKDTGDYGDQQKPRAIL